MPAAVAQDLSDHRRYESLSELAERVGQLGYAVAPPSKHASGSSYVWVRDPGKHHMSELPD